MTCHAASHRGGSCRVSKGFTIIFLGWNIFWKIIFLDSLDLICGLLVSLLDVFYWRFLWSRLGFNSSNLISLDVKIMTAPGYNHFEQMRVYLLLMRADSISSEDLNEQDQRQHCRFVKTYPENWCLQNGCLRWQETHIWGCSCYFCSTKTEIQIN